MSFSEEVADNCMSVCFGSFVDCVGVVAIHGSDVGNLQCRAGV